MSDRASLPARRHAESFTFEHEGHTFRIMIGCDPVELLETGHAIAAEIFVNAEKSDRAIDALASDIAILLSLLLQYGAVPAAIGHALRRNPDHSRASLVGALVDALAGFHFDPPLPGVPATNWPSVPFKTEQA
jgi:hypothetical protein